jgi:hypothetical protein
MAATVLGLLTLAACGGDPTLAGTLAPPAPGSLAVTVTGLPAGAPANLTLSSASGYHRAVTGSETIPDLVAGTYTLAAVAVTADGDGVRPRARDAVRVRAGRRAIPTPVASWVSTVWT